MSADVERRVYELLGRPSVSPYGNRIPGLAELDAGVQDEPESGEPVVSLATLARDGEVVIRRISEQLQTDTGVIHQLHEAGVGPGAAVTMSSADGEFTLTHEGVSVRIPRALAGLVFVSAP